jgi:hypothetical protein
MAGRLYIGKGDVVILKESMVGYGQFEHHSVGDKLTVFDTPRCELWSAHQRTCQAEAGECPTQGRRITLFGISNPDGARGWCADSSYFEYPRDLYDEGCVDRMESLVL